MLKSEGIELYAGSDHKYKDVLGQLELPTYLKEHKFDPTFVKCDKKIVHYDMRGLHVWRALFSFSHTVLQHKDTWLHLIFLAFIGVFATFITLMMDHEESIADSDSLISRLQLLIAFCFSGYVSLIVNRWDHVRNVYLTNIWGSLENINFHLISKISKTLETSEEPVLIKKLIRYSRLCMYLVFKALQNEVSLNEVSALNLVTEKEIKWLEATQAGTRPLLVVGWISGLCDEFDDFLENKTTLSNEDKGIINYNISTLRGGIGGVLGFVNTQLPYSYVHVIYWTIQLLLVSLALESGVECAMKSYTKINGNGNYTPPDDDYVWPINSNIWFTNWVFQMVTSKVVFALFCEGLLNICDKLTNPMSREDTSFSERLFTTNMYNNCRAIRAGCYSYAQDQLDNPVLFPPELRNSDITEETEEKLETPMTIFSQYHVMN